MHLQCTYKSIKNNTNTYVDRDNAKKTDVTRPPITNECLVNTKRSADESKFKPAYSKRALSTDDTHVLTANKKCDRKQNRGTKFVSTEPKKLIIPHTIPPSKKSITVTNQPNIPRLKFEPNHGPKNNLLTDVTKQFTNQQNKIINLGKQKIPTRHEIYKNCTFGKTS